MTFHDYLRTLQDEDTPEGDVARDVLADKRAPTSDDYGRLREHVESAGAPSKVMDLLDKVYANYEQQ